ncbi:hypothetical protein NHX12_008792 [Muraenolepis orangiensis]|uniref:Protein kinase domain-containing protein n=1 Tax=Muraenolepis orangiensis TaxID=630683 RepID=A0A9Q0I9P3_9TELE|nr:hypothetical protein NHX12_008792 [Muraenolepis orangiensis]
MRDLFSPTQVYHVLEEVGRGTFGTVFKCLRRGRNGQLVVAVKRLTLDRHSYRGIRNELKLLRAVCSDEDSSTKCHIVRFFEEFSDLSHQYLVFEMLEKSLHQLQSESGFRPMAVRNIRVITDQMLKALQKLKELGVVHADVKPENIMLVHHSRFPFRVKLIDFGRADILSKVRSVRAPYIQSRYYRAPEVLLGLPFSEKVDMWSLGCVMSELYLGWPLYPGDSEMQQVSYICKTQGLPHESLLHSASKTHLFFKRNMRTGAAQWQLKADGKQDRRKYLLSSLDQLSDMDAREREPGLLWKDTEAEESDRRCMVNLLKRILTLGSRWRISPERALGHAFLTLEHLVARSAQFSSYHRSATLAMEQALLQLPKHVIPQPPPHPAHHHRPNKQPCCSREPRTCHPPRPGPLSQAENQPQGSRVQPPESPCQPGNESEDQRAETDDDQSPSRSEESVRCGSEVGGARSHGRHSEFLGRTWDPDITPVVLGCLTTAPTSPATNGPTQRR